MLRYLVDATNQLLLNLERVTPQEIEALAEARRQTERELAHLIAFVRFELWKRPLKFDFLLSY